MNRPRLNVPLVLCVALAAVSAAGTLVRLAPDADPLTLAFGRVFIAGVVLLPFGLRALQTGDTQTGQSAMPSRRDIVLTCIAGVFLALHFYAWFSSLQRTTVMRSTVLVCTTPVWVGLLEGLVLRRPPPRRYWPGIGIALMGIIGLTLGETLGADTGAAAGLDPAAGDSLALLGSWLGASYFVIGSVVRQRVGIAVYGPLVCLAAAAALFVLAAVQGAPWIPTGPAIAVVLAMAAGPQLLGHVGFNWAVRYIPARVIASMILLEPVGASVLAAVLLHELPTVEDCGWGLLLLIGVCVAVSQPQPEPQKEAVNP